MSSKEMPEPDNTNSGAEKPTEHALTEREIALLAEGGLPPPNIDPAVSAAIRAAIQADTEQLLIKEELYPIMPPEDCFGGPNPIGEWHIEGGEKVDTVNQVNSVVTF